MFMKVLKHNIGSKTCFKKFKDQDKFDKCKFFPISWLLDSDRNTFAPISFFTGV